MNNKLILSSIAIALFATLLNISNSGTAVKNNALNLKTGLLQNKITQMSCGNI